jgi:hypothetical protein
MQPKGRAGLKEGGTVWLPCEVKQGMFPTERYIQLFVADVTMPISGFVPTEDVRDPKSPEERTGQVRAVIAHLTNDKAALLFRGEILSATNPVVVPSKWILTKTSIAGR